VCVDSASSRDVQCHRNMAINHNSFVWHAKRARCDRVTTTSHDSACKLAWELKGCACLRSGGRGVAMGSSSPAYLRQAGAIPAMMLDRPVGARDEAIALVRTLRSIGVLAVTVPHSRIRHTLPPTDHDTPSATTNNGAFAKITLCPTCMCAECVCLCVRAEDNAQCQERVWATCNGHSCWAGHVNEIRWW